MEPRTVSIRWIRLITVCNGVKVRHTSIMAAINPPMVMVPSITPSTPTAMVAIPDPTTMTLPSVVTKVVYMLFLKPPTAALADMVR